MNEHQQHTGDEGTPITRAGFRFDDTYTELPPPFFTQGRPHPAPEPNIIIVNEPLADSLGLKLHALSSGEQATLFSGTRLAQGSNPFSQAYAGHQFGGFSILGDGRAHVLGEHVTPNGTRVDIQLKGSGHTPYSRRGDGRATLGPMLREYIISEAMAGLGIPTTRSLAVATTGETVQRELLLPGAVLTRVASSHLRVGTFEFAEALENRQYLDALVDYALERHDPHLRDSDIPALALWDAVAERQMSLIIAWMRIGFVHGVMNTDNMTVSGETIDYGPCAFLDSYAARTVFSSIDHGGRYAFGNQPRIAQWNLARFAEALLPSIDSDRNRAIARAQERVQQLAAKLNDAWTGMMRDKLGLPGRRDDDTSLAMDLLELMEATSSDYTNTFRALAGATSLPTELEQTRGWGPWKARWDHRCGRPAGAGLSAESEHRMRNANPAIIPRNHVVEETLNAAVDSEDLEPLHQLLEALKSPYQERKELEPFQEPAPDSLGHYETFCGT